MEFGGSFGVPDDSSDVAQFNSVSPTVTLNGTFTIQQLQFTGTASPTFNNGNTLSQLILSNASGPGVISTTGTSAPTVNVEVVDGSTGGLSLDVNDSSTMTLPALSSAVTHGQIVKNGAGTLVLSGGSSNTFLNVGERVGLFLKSGTTNLQKSARNAISSSVIVGSAATLNLLGGNQIADNASLTLFGGSSMSLVANETVDQIFGSGLLILNDHQLTLGGSQVSTVSVIDILGGVLNVAGNYGALIFREGTGGQLPQIIGTGKVGSITTDGTQGNLSPGAAANGDGSTGVLNVGGTISTGGGNLQLMFGFKGNTIPGEGFDQIVISGNGQVASGVSASFAGLATFPLVNGQSVRIVDVQNGGSVAPFPGFSEGSVIGQANGGATDLRISYAGGDGNDVWITAFPNGTNSSPVANTDEAALDEDAFVNIDVMANDTDPNPLDTLSIVNVSNPAHGTAVLNGNVILYTPNPDYFGSDTFTYTLSDGEGGSGIGAVNVTVQDVPDLISYAPTSISANGRTATFLQSDGDTLVVKTNVGKFTAANFRFAGPSCTPGMGILQVLDLSASTAATTGFSFKKATINTTVIPGQNGDGFADIGYINATGTDLKSVSLRGDLGRIDAGDSNFKRAGLGALKALSIGTRGIATQPDPGASADVIFTTTIVGKLGSLNISKGKLANAPQSTGSIQDAFIRTIADGTEANLKYAGIGKVVVDNLDGAFGGYEELVETDGLIYIPGAILAEGRIGKVLVTDGVLFWDNLCGWRIAGGKRWSCHRRER